MKKFWKKIYNGFLAFAAGLMFFVLARFFAPLLFIGLLCFLGGAIYNTILAIKKLKIDRQEILINMLKINQILEEDNKEGDMEKEILNAQVLEKLEVDANRFKFWQILIIAGYLAVAFLAVFYFIRVFIMLF